MPSSPVAWAAMLLLLCAAPTRGVGARGAWSDANEIGTPMSDPALDSLRLRLEIPDGIRLGDPVSLTLVLENIGSRRLTLSLLGRTIAFDIRIRAEDGEVVWRRLEGEVLPAILRVEVLEPGASLRLAGQWDQRSNAGRQVPPGRYRAQGELLTEGEPLLSAAVELVVQP